MDLKKEFLRHRHTVVENRAKFDLRKAEERAHILEGLKIALDHLDAVITLIRSSANPPEAKAGLMEQFKLTEVQAQAILDMRLARLTGLERKKIEEEYRELIEKIAHYKEVLANRGLRMAIVREELTDLVGSYGDERRTEIIDGAGEFSIEDLDQGLNAFQQVGRKLSVIS